MKSQFFLFFFLKHTFHWTPEKQQTCKYRATQTALKPLISFYKHCFLKIRADGKFILHQLNQTSESWIGLLWEETPLWTQPPGLHPFGEHGSMESPLKRKNHLAIKTMGMKHTWILFCWFNKQQEKAAGCLSQHTGCSYIAVYFNIRLLRQMQMLYDLFSLKLVFCSEPKYFI